MGYIEAALSVQSRTVRVDNGDVKDDLVREMTEVLTSLCARLRRKRVGRGRAKNAVAAVQGAGA